MEERSYPAPTWRSILPPALATGFSASTVAASYFALRGLPFLRETAPTAVYATLSSTVFWTVQQNCAHVRGRQDPMNSLIAGASVGTLLGCLRGDINTLRSGVGLFGCGAAFIHVIVNYADRNWDSSKDALVATGSWIASALPIRKLSAEEVQAKRDEELHFIEARRLVHEKRGS